MEEGKTNQTGAHHHHTDQGVFGPTPVANTGTCQPARTIDAPVVREGIIPPTVGAEGAPTSCIRVRRSRTRQQTRERGGSPKAARRGGLSPEADRKKHKSRATATTPAEQMDETVYVEGDTGDLTSYVPTG